MILKYFFVWCFLTTNVFSHSVHKSLYPTVLQQAWSDPGIPAPGYPASTWPLQAKKAKNGTPYHSFSSFIEDPQLDHALEEYIDINITRGDNGKFGVNNRGVVIVALTPGGQAEKQGDLQVGDTIIEIDQKSTTGMTTDDISTLIQNLGTSATLRVMRAGRRCTGGNACCTSTERCGAGQGDCDSSSQCEGGLLCGSDNCDRHTNGSAFEAGDDCCWDYEGYCDCDYHGGWTEGGCKIATAPEYGHGCECKYISALYTCKGYAFKCTSAMIKNGLCQGDRTFKSCFGHCGGY